MYADLNSSVENRKSVDEYLIRNNVPITEQPNYLTRNIDLANTGENILKLLFQTDKEIFDGWKIRTEKENLKTDGLKTDFFILDKISRLSNILAEKVKEHLKPENKTKRFKLILSGCGTSGRIAYLTSQTFNSYMKSKFDFVDYDLCDYIIAGDDYALVNSVESVEDKPKIGADKLKSILDQNKDTTCIFIGITCGFSAPFVAGQIDYCLNELKDSESNKVIACGIVGFNSVELTRKTQPINQNNETFYDLMVKMKECESKEPNKYFIINPLIGPEPITGSSRMKSGTTTKIIFDLIISKMFNLIDANDVNKNGVLNELDMIEFYEILLNKVVYSEETIKSLGDLIDQSVESLRNLQQGASINYLSDSERLGLLCCVDASECLPTYGASKTDIKGFISASNRISLSNLKSVNQWNGFVHNCTTTWSQNIVDNFNDFTSSKCVFILIDDDQDANNLNSSIPTKNYIENQLLKDSECKIYHLNLSSVKKEISSNPRVKVLNLNNFNEILENSQKKINSYFSQCLQEFVLKLCLNAISTGAHVLFGKTYENIMIDVKVSNIKLYWRAVGILKKFTNQETSSDECEQYLLNSIYSGDPNSSMKNKSSIEEHIDVATGQNLIVPKALIMAITKCNYKEATTLLNESHNSVRNCIFKLKN